MPGPEGIEGQKVSGFPVVSFALYKHNFRPEGSGCTSSLYTLIFNISCKVIVLQFLQLYDMKIQVIHVYFGLIVLNQFFFCVFACN